MGLVGDGTPFCPLGEIEMADQILSSVTSHELGSSRIDSEVHTRNGLNVQTAATAVETRTLPAQWGMAAIYLLLAYEWWSLVLTRY
jgi:hypothetical protein